MNKKLLALVLPACLLFGTANAETVNLEGKDYQMDRLIEQEIGPGIYYKRLRLPSYPLNVNLLMVDLNNPYNRIETTTANDKSKGTEGLAAAAKRQSHEGHRALAGANANFWVVASQRENKTYNGTARNASVRNGKIVVESNQHRDQWDGGTMRTGVVGMSYDKTMYVDYCTSSIRVSNDKIGSLEVHQVNKGIHNDELCMYNSFYGGDREFMPILIDANNNYDFDPANDATEVILDLAEGEAWNSGRDITLNVVEVRKDAGHGKLGEHDMALVGRGANRTAIAALAPGDKVTLKYTWTYNPGSADEVTPLIEQAVGPNALVMRGGELTAHNTNEAYNSQVYSRTGYGTSADGKTLYIIVIDKSTDPVYGLSAGCNTTKMCEIARYFGCTNMANFDAGGSAEMFVNGSVINKTTESQPRAVANGWLIYSIAPEDDDAVARIEFNDPELKAPIYSSFEPTIIAYNKYGAVVDYDLSGFTLSCDPSLGSCDGSMFTAAGKPGSGMLTAEYNGVTVSKKIDVMEAAMGLRIKSLLIDATREYPIEVTASLGDVTYTYNPASLEWSVADPSIVSIDANGVLKALKEGKTTITGRIGEFSDQAEVTVEIADKATLSLAAWDGWTVKGASGMTKVTMSDNGVVSYSYGTPRDASVTLTKAHRFYSLPDRLFIEFTTSIPVERVLIDLKTADAAKATVLTFDNNSEGFAANERVKLEIPISSVGDPKDLIIYPLTFSYIKFTTKRASEYRGTQTFTLHDIYAEYDNFSDGVENVIADSNLLIINPNPVDAASDFTIKAGGVKSVRIYGLNGAVVSSTEFNGADNVSVAAPATTGVYLVDVEAADGVSTAKLIVK